ncbi:YhgE/Pip family protein [Parasporobacterium paucivorans]|uniref:Putative membrane protein n=1 Tax=Parasporobacterium paucivorans DSM 15970 TaxID=1122934 RepID=A0A1M6IQC1_9FIRM|nr:YhgE/Pip domain-containing protein [Parasporobacterium paucivorans]SHJ36666.1 putative membrane protein [Parasporobacterium paucivorans DSM 15970]
MSTGKKKSTKGLVKTILIVATIGVLFVPVLYSAVYLGSIWDVYGKVSNVPVAFVNLDKPVERDGKEYAVGRELEDKLKTNDKVAWKFLSYDEAERGVEGDDYYAMIVVPEDFSQRVADAGGGNLERPEIIYTANKGRNFVFSQISERVAQGLKTEISSNIQKEISKVLVESLYDVRVSIKAAGDGASTIQSGTQKLYDGSEALVVGTEQAAEGSLKLKDGIYSAANGSSQLGDGTLKLYEGSSSLSQGIGTAAEGSRLLQTGLTAAASGEGQLASGIDILVNGLVSFKNGLLTKNEQISLLVKGADKLSSTLNTSLNVLAEGVDQAAKETSQASDILNSEVDNIKNSDLSDVDKEKIIAAISTVDKINRSDMSSNITEPLRQAATSADPLAASLKQLYEGSNQISSGIAEQATGLESSMAITGADLDQLIAGAKSLQSGSYSLLEGMNTAAVKTSRLSQGLDTLNSGAQALNYGIKSVNDGTEALNQGLNTAAVKTGELSSGLTKLSDGTAALSDSLGQANEGAIKLSDGLNAGDDELNNMLTFNAENMSDYVSDPVVLKTNPINDVKHYGEGFAPYFMSLSLWLGAMFISIVFTVARFAAVYKGKFLGSFWGKLISGSLLVTIQALILSYVVLNVLNINAVSVRGFYLGNIFTAVAFYCIMYGLQHAIGFFASPVLFVALIFQIASSGGTFPIEATPEIYRVIGTFLPMTYTVKILKMIISGINIALLKENISIMLVYVMLFLAGGAAVRAMINRIKTIRDPKIIENADSGD